MIIKENDISKIYELSNETLKGMKESWIKENYRDLMYAFLEDNSEEFNIFLENEIVDEDRDIDYWMDIFCKEEMSEDFYDFIDNSYNEYEDIRGVK